MLKKYLSKFAMDILPSVAATIIGAYIVNHYIVTKPGPDAPAAAGVSSVDPKKADVKGGAKPAETSADVANIPEPGVKAKGISEKAILEKTAAEKPAAVEKSPEKPAEKSADKPTETASIPVETRRHLFAPREKAIAKSAPVAVPVQPAAPASAPVVAAPTTAPAVEAAAPVEEHRDANDLARAAIERLRGAGDGSPHAQEAARAPDAARVVAAPVVATPTVRPLPPPIMVSTPSGETFDSGSSPTRSSYPSATRGDDPGRPTPPADIPPAPASQPLDLRAEAAEPAMRDHTSVAEDMLSAAKSVFHAVLPK
jgi:hypothetical protein